ncbi:MAG: peptidyl-prolyl cis-trans isomerase [Solirubrobacterales bacterium]
MNNITSNKYFIPGFAAVVTLIVVLILVVFRGGVPDTAVAVVDGTELTKADFNKTLKIFASQSQPEAKGNAVVPDPPTYAKCIANKRKAQKKATNAQLKQRCVTEFNDAKEQIMMSMIQSVWYEKEAEERGIKITDAEVKQRFTPLKQQTFPKDADYKKFLASTGQTEADLLKLVKGQIIQEKIRESVSKSKQPTAKDIEAAYNKNKDRYTTPASRDLLIVFTNKKSEANAALSALDSGDRFDAVAKKYSEDTASKGQGGKFPGATKGQFEPALDKAVFAAKKGETKGPIKTQFGYYIFQVTKINTAKKKTLREASAEIKQTLVSESQQKGFDDFQKEFREKWKGKTECAELYKMSLCDGEKEKAEPTAETGAPAN